MNDLIAKLDSRQFYLLLGGTVLLVAAVLVSLFLLPQVRIYRAAKIANAGLPPVPADAAVLQSMLAERDSAIAERSRQLHGDMADLPVREVEAFVIDRLQLLAWNHNVTLEGVRPSTGEAVESFQEILFRLELSGHYASLFGWLRELRSELGFIVIKEYQMNRAGEEADDPMLNVRLTIASYRKEAS